jgi:polysaccharide export outer membrane protein
MESIRGREPTLKRIAWHLLLAAGACSPALPAEAQARKPQSVRPAPAADPGTTPYRIGPEDVLVISVWQNAELTRSVPVRPDGRISLPLLRDVIAAGRTPAELAEDIEEGLKSYMTAAVVSVIVAEVNSYRVSVLGKVANPGRYSFKAPTTVLEALAAAGGMVEYAKTDDILVLRPDPSRRISPGGAKPFVRMKFNYSAALKAAGPTAANFELLPHDIVIVE